MAKTALTIPLLCREAIAFANVRCRSGGWAVRRLTMTRQKERAEYGDFQTPPELAAGPSALLAEQGLQPAALTDLRSRQLSVRWLRPIHRGSEERLRPTSRPSMLSVRESLFRGEAMPIR